MEAVQQTTGDSARECRAEIEPESMDTVGGCRKEQRTEAGATAGGKVSTAAIMRLIESQGYKCALSGVDLTPKDATLDHKIPLAREGAHTMENAQVLHADVNRAKGMMTNEEFIAMCSRIAAHSSGNAALINKDLRTFS